MFSEELLNKVRKDLDDQARADRLAGHDPAAQEEIAIKMAFAKPTHQSYWTSAILTHGMLNVFASMLTSAFILGRRYAEAEALEGLEK